MLIIGDNEAEARKVSVRRQGIGDLGIMSVDEFITFFEGELSK
jgi:threonyl-tRNA synthetase